MRLIDADAVVLQSRKDLYAYESSLVKDYLDLFPTIEAEPVRHGRWIYHECVCSYDGTKSGYSCSECNGFVDEEMFDTDEFHKIFCGNCGCKMDGESE